MLEVVCGRRALGWIEGNNLVDYAWELHGKGQLINGADSRLKGKFEEGMSGWAFLLPPRPEGSAKYAESGSSPYKPK